jgi:hypothetical protein
VNRGCRAARARACEASNSSKWSSRHPLRSSFETGRLCSKLSLEAPSLVELCVE